MISAPSNFPVRAVAVRFVVCWLLLSGGGQVTARESASLEQIVSAAKAGRRYQRATGDELVAVRSCSRGRSAIRVCQASRKNGGSLDFNCCNSPMTFPRHGCWSNPPSRSEVGGVTRSVRNACQAWFCRHLTAMPIDTPIMSRCGCLPMATSLPPHGIPFLARPLMWLTRRIIPSRHSRAPRPCPTDLLRDPGSRFLAK